MLTINMCYRVPTAFARDYFLLLLTGNQTLKTVQILFQSTSPKPVGRIKDAPPILSERLVEIRENQKCEAPSYTIFYAIMPRQASILPHIPYRSVQISYRLLGQIYQIPRSRKNRILCRSASFCPG